MAASQSLVWVMVASQSLAQGMVASQSLVEAMVASQSLVEAMVASQSLAQVMVASQSLAQVMVASLGPGATDLRTVNGCQELVGQSSCSCRRPTPPLACSLNSLGDFSQLAV